MQAASVPTHPLQVRDFRLYLIARFATIIGQYGLLLVIAWQAYGTDGSQWGVGFTWIIQEKPDGLAQAYLLTRDFLNGAPSAMVVAEIQSSLKTMTK